MRRIRALGFLLAIASIPVLAANFSGKWALRDANGRGGRGGPTVLTLNQVGDTVTGTISLRIDAGSNSPVNNEIWGGRVAGDTLSFYVWTGADQPVKTSYRGTLSASGDEIVFTVSGGRGAGFGGFGGGQPASGARGGAGTSGQPASGRTAPAPAGGAGASQPITAQRVK